MPDSRWGRCGPERAIFCSPGRKRSPSSSTTWPPRSVRACGGWVMAEQAASPAAYLGLDVGTSGVRGVAIDAGGTVLAQASAPLPAPMPVDGGLRQDPELWWSAVARVTQAVTAALPGHRLEAVTGGGTSGTLLVPDSASVPLEAAGMYNDASAASLARRIKAVAPPASGAHGAT